MSKIRNQWLALAALIAGIFLLAALPLAAQEEETAPEMAMAEPAETEEQGFTFTVDPIAIGVMLEAQQSGLTVPGDLSVAGFDDIELAANLAPALTTVHVPVEEICTLAGDYLVARIEGRPARDRVALEARLHFDLFHRQRVVPLERLSWRRDVDRSGDGRDAIRPAGGRRPGQGGRREHVRHRPGGSEHHAGGEGDRETQHAWLRQVEDAPVTFPRAPGQHEPRLTVEPRAGAGHWSCLRTRSR